MSHSPAMPRLGERSAVDQPAMIRLPVRGRLGRVRVERRPVTVVEVSVSGASVVAQQDIGLTERQTVELELGDRLGVARVVWVRPLDEGRVRSGLQFLDPNPAFLPVIYAWMGRSRMTEQVMRG